MNFQFLNKRLVAFGGGAVLVVFVATLSLAVWRVQNQKPTVTMPKAAGPCEGGSQCPTNDKSICGESYCSGCSWCSASSGDSGGSGPWIEGCKYKYDTADIAKCTANPVSEASTHIYTQGGTELIGDSMGNRNSFSTGKILTPGKTYKFTVDNYPDYYHWPWRAYVCVGKHLCFSGGKSKCADSVTGNTWQTGISCDKNISDPTVVNSNEVTITVPDSGASSAVGFEVNNESTPVNNFTAIDPINNKPVSSLTPTFSWNSDGVAYQVICIGTYADGHPPGSCNFVNCTADFSPAVHSYVPTTPLLPNTDYRWLVYGQPGNPAPTTGCQSFKTGASCSSGQTLCSGACKNLQTDTANCGACGSACSSSQTCSNGSCVNNATHLVCGTSNTCVSVAGAGNNTDGCVAAGASCTVAATCNATTCPSGCCQGNVCNPGVTKDACGKGGAVCSACSSQQVCNVNSQTCGLLVGIIGCKEFDGTLCNDASNAPLTLASVPVLADGVAATALFDVTQPNSYQFPIASGNHTVSVGALSGYDISYAYTDSNGVYHNFVAGNSVTVNVGSGVTGAVVVNWNFKKSGTACATGQTSCSGVCRNLQTDTANCGACGTACASTQTCSSGVCTATGSNEVNSCWGNGGTSGKCYDCNGDGVVNILDFSCFAKLYSKPVN